MSTPRWYRETGNIYFADVGRVGSLIWMPEEEWHTDVRCDELLRDAIDPPEWIMNFKWENDSLEDAK